MRSIKSAVSLSSSRETSWSIALFSLGMRSVRPPGFWYMFLRMSLRAKSWRFLQIQTYLHSQLDRKPGLFEVSGICPKRTYGMRG